MKFILVIAVAVGLAGAAGFFIGGSFFQQEATSDPMPETQEDVAKDVPAAPLFQMPLGKFTMRVTRKTRVAHVLMDLDVFMQGATAFEKMNGAIGRARLRDASVIAFASLAESSRWSNPDAFTDLNKRALAEEVVRKIHEEFPMVVTARFNQLTISESLREPAQKASLAQRKQ